MYSCPSYPARTSHFLRRIVRSSLAYLVLPHSYTLFHEQHEFLEQFFEYRMCALIFCTTFV